MGMPRETFQRYNAEGRFAELRTMTPRGRVAPRSTVSTGPDEVMGAVPGTKAGAAGLRGEDAATVPSWAGPAVAAMSRRLDNLGRVLHR